MQEPPFDTAVTFVGWALLPVTVLDGQECPSYNEQGADVGSVSRPKYFFSRAFGSKHGGLEATATPPSVP